MPLASPPGMFGALSDSELLEKILGERVDLPLARIETDGAVVLHSAGRRDSALRLQAVLELHRRLSRSPLPREDPLDSPAVLAERLRPRFRNAVREEFLLLLLDGRLRLLREVIVSIGTRDATLVVPRDALVEAIRDAADGVMAVHNHPSGSALPSPEDVQVTRRLREVCRLAGIRFVDHVIVTESAYFSFQEEGM